LPEQYANVAVNWQAGKDRKELIRVCSDISVGQVASSVVNYISMQVEDYFKLNEKCF